MDEEKLREYFDAYYDTHINGTMLNRESAWEFQMQKLNLLKLSSF